MLSQEGESRSHAIDLRLAAALSLMAGALNAAGFQVAGLFSANMTGNVSALADHLALGGFGLAALFALVVLLFISGALLAGCLIEVGRQRGMRRVYASVVLLEASLMMLLGALGLWAGVLADGIGLICALSFALGLQNGVTTRISRARVRTTHVSGMATDIGLALAGLWLGRAEGEAGRHRAQLVLHTTTILAFLSGGVLGALCHIWLGPGAFLVAGLGLGAIAAPDLLRREG